MRRLAFVALGVAGLSAAVCGGGFLALSHLDLAAFATRKLTKATGRTVHIGSVHLSPGRWMTIDVDDLSIANIPNGSRPEMIKLGHLHTQVRLMSLLHGPAETRDLVLTGFSGLFERTADRTPNWRFGAPSKPDNKPEEKKNSAPDWSWFPGIRQAVIKDSEIIYRSANGHSYRTNLDVVTLSSTSDSSPFEMTVSGGYNDTPIALTAHLGPLTVLREAGKPYPTNLHATSGDLTLDLDGTMTDLFDFDGIDGKLTLRTPTSAPLIAIAGVSPDSFHMTLNLQGHFTHKGDVWTISRATGLLRDNPIENADITFTEGKSGSPDEIVGDMAFARLDLNGLQSATQSNGKSGQHATDIPLVAPARPDPLFNVKLSSRSVRYNDLVFSDASLATSLQPGRIDVSALQLSWMKASLHASGEIVTHPRGSSLHAMVDVSKADIDTFRREAGLAPVPVSGTLSFRVKASAEGVRTLNEASRNADIQAVVGMNSGQISKEVIGIASSNIGTLFGTMKGTTPVTCLLGALKMSRGEGAVVPLRIYTPAGSIVGEALFDLNRRWFELAFQSRAAASLALDIPIRVSGPFNSPSIGLAGWSARGRALLKDAQTINTLPTEMASFTPGRACLSVLK
ncbi:hypothetical protein AA0242T_0058 [Acetobacter aceti NRIC 0242]|uniref:AsmA-like C-terminal domain-containing protein n=1 Tax=Acetobacter aceti NBRC 14818 TaxID=887700 RepID=A0AB33IAE5_ACEAC|nr:AsmA-like C-terminal region-containing protein [Acetobacter aceti]TCS35486.1 uncharacterized protein involved in outer membrane biogenesis [Acetobacter aceti NBRC 14818]BCK75127.1 hypothetical protein EMQ_0733 [Acetobacter aceti NBRC 14818]GAN57583.1 hypothetical protein Abac_017_284 [Acetobacter aceti NBRC 14818]GBO79356.1 hypothetical protein AA0242T_0058 [Acetobacter aceti NRIC 0242]